MTCWVYVSSSPWCAAVILDGTNYGQTPGSGSLKLNSIGVGDHMVPLILAGYQSHTARVTVYANTVSKISSSSVCQAKRRGWRIIGLFNTCWRKCFYL